MKLPNPQLLSSVFSEEIQGKKKKKCIKIEIVCEREVGQMKYKCLTIFKI